MKYEREMQKQRRTERIIHVIAVVIVLAIITGIYFIGAHLLRPWLDKLDKIEASAVPVATTTVIIEPGTTLWHIAREWHPDTDPREIVYIIRQLNPGLDPGRLQVGQQILVPEVGY